jgi:hypothetical protein
VVSSARRHRSVRQMLVDVSGEMVRAVDVENENHANENGVLLNTTLGSSAFAVRTRYLTISSRNKTHEFV